MCGPGLSPSALATGPHQCRAQPVDTAELTAGPGPHRDPEWSLPSPGSCTRPGWGAWGPGGQAAIPTPIRANFRPSWEGADSPPEEPWPQGSHRTGPHPPPHGLFLSVPVNLMLVFSDRCTAVKLSRCFLKVCN